MQSGVTGINAMRVYSVTKQAIEQDPRGTFIRKYVPELRRVPTKYIHRPHTMPVHIANSLRIVDDAFRTYPRPIVDEKITAKQSKAAVMAIRRQKRTMQQAAQVYKKHGSRSNKRSGTFKIVPIRRRVIELLQSLETKKRVENKSTISKGNATPKMVKSKQMTSAAGQHIKQRLIQHRTSDKVDLDRVPRNKFTKTSINTKQPTLKQIYARLQSTTSKAKLITKGEQLMQFESSPPFRWVCSACTYLNESKSALSCEICRTTRGSNVIE